LSRISVFLPVPPDRAFQLLEDPRSLRALVAGARRIRRFDPRWPEPGSAVHHSLGVPPLGVRDVTVVTECEPGRRLVLKAGIHYLGSLIVEFELEPHGTGTVLSVTERPAAGAVNLPGMREIVDAAAAVRNAGLGRRFAKLIAKRERLAATADKSRPSSDHVHRQHA
jgi:uncharacterized protein YndB with AHSA1/START domain